MTEPREDLGLTPKQEAFALAYFETGNAAEAYRRAYDVADAAKDQWLYVEASQLLDHPKVSLRLEQLRSEAERLSIYTRQAAMDEYEKARSVAESIANPSAMVSAINGKVKLWGLEAPARSRTEVVGKNGGPIQTEDVTNDATAFARRMAGLAARPDGTGDSEPERGSEGDA